MSVAKMAVAAAAVGLGYVVWQGHRQHAEAAAIRAITDSHGFMELTPPNGGRPDQVMIFAAVNCPHDGAQRADRLAREMAERGIPYLRSSHASVTPPAEGDADAFVRRYNDVMNGDVPIVFVNGRVRANPGVEDVVAEYESARR